MAFSLDRRGSGDSIRAFLEKLPHQSSLVWVTFSLNPPDTLLRFMERRELRTTIVCMHPMAVDGVPSGPATVRASAFRVLAPFVRRGLVRLLGLARTAPLSDGEDPDPFGPLHAKFVVVREPNGSTFHLALGSFNLASNSLFENTETFYRVRDLKEAEQAWREAEKLLQSPRIRPVTAEDCVEGPGLGVLRPHRPGLIEGGPAQVEAKPLVPERPGRSISLSAASDEVLRSLIGALDERLQNWPEPNQDWQHQAFLRLQERAVGRRNKTDLLYLPVGVGKTFIALRWLLEQVVRSYEASRKKAYGAFLAPNEWVQKSVLADLAELARTAGVSSESAEWFVRVVRPKLALEDGFRPCAAVADECHNWNADATRSGAPTYSLALNLLRELQVPILGLSATPCRMDRGAYSVPHFASEFLGDHVEEFEPGMTLSQAIHRHQLLAPPSYHRLLDKAREDVRALLSEGDALVSMGDYSKATLRKVWDALGGRVPELVGEITQAFQRHQSRKAVVFLPPVDDDSDAFVETLREEVGEEHLLDFRSRSAARAEASELFERFSSENPKPGRPLVLLTVDRFAEGVSITDIDTLVMLRATLSPRVAVQALGRGLRKDRRKTCCVVLDAVLFKERLDQWERNVLREEAPPHPAPPPEPPINPAEAPARSRPAPFPLLGWASPRSLVDPYRVSGPRGPMEYFERRSEAESFAQAASANPTPITLSVEQRQSDDGWKVLCSHKAGVKVPPPQTPGGASQNTARNRLRVAFEWAVVKGTPGARLQVLRSESEARNQAKELSAKQRKPYYLARRAPDSGEVSVLERYQEGEADPGFSPLTR